ncbi:MAG: hypothetical protein NTV23_13515 [Propionibacteriales bacterium]|nr:hypothetical protein [Propionibacteriales bacterium]
MKKLLAAFAASLTATGGLLAFGLTTQAADAASCPNNNWSNITQALVLNNFVNNGVNIRTGDSTSCTAVGQGQQTHDTVLHCRTWSGSSYWTHLWDRDTAKSGWVRNDQLWVTSGNPC